MEREISALCRFRRFLTKTSISRCLSLLDGSWCTFHAQTRIASGHHEEQRRLMTKIQTAIDVLLSCSGNDCQATLLDTLKSNLSVFEKELMGHLDHEELFFSSPVARKVSPSLSLRNNYSSTWYTHGCRRDAWCDGVICSAFWPEHF